MHMQTEHEKVADETLLDTEVPGQKCLTRDFLTFWCVFTQDL